MKIKQIKKEEFVLNNYVAKTYISGNRKFMLKEGRIENLPHIENGVIDIQDSHIPDKGFSLILRLSKTQKTFYFRSPTSTMKKIGTWQARTNSRYYAKGSVSLAKAREIAGEMTDESRLNSLDQSGIAHLTIKEYLECGQYKRDREIKKIKSNKIKRLDDRTVNNILHGARTLLDYKIKDINVEWFDLLQSDWNTPYQHKGNNTETVKSLDTQRKYYTMINAMFNVWEKAGYIRKNPIGDLVTTFKDESKSDDKRIVNTIDEVPIKEAVDYVIEKFDESTPKSFHGKIVLTTMMLIGCRNCEVYRNYKRNWDFAKRSVTIPGEIILKTHDTRVIPIEHEGYWKMMKRYFSKGSPFYYATKQGFLLPNPDSKTGHATDNCTREHWKNFKVIFNIPQKKRLYDFRHTFANNLRTLGHDVATVANYLGDDPATVAKYYFKKDSEIARNEIKSLHSGEGVSLRNETSELVEAKAAELWVETHEEYMPPKILSFFNMFKSGKVRDGKILQSAFSNFLKLLNSIDANFNEPESQAWLAMQKV